MHWKSRSLYTRIGGRIRMTQNWQSVDEELSDDALKLSSCQMRTLMYSLLYCKCIAVPARSGVNKKIARWTWQTNMLVSIARLRRKRAEKSKIDALSYKREKTMFDRLAKWQRSTRETMMLTDAFEHAATGTSAFEALDAYCCINKRKQTALEALGS